ncbi:Low-affinity inorganic phosphate transporter 1 [Candidatus Erwinia haradaeae]|uniref:Phosphate transporter n=1 Tax=Candidatus Erwinia haradaeae TaxID=1922217 RepID=A0A451D024_9GAMM|nr:inorganic phosphate transporter PitA [Candidatus Erwinia haradaeae]VFP78961.1 Low-affinity inorganic phosphate transporter 1 [Candidatus Erwinia haradaeae]
MLDLFSNLDIHGGLLLLALLFVLFYEAINGFHDTANAVATVIYTRAMSSKFAVVMAGVFNFFGVLLGGLSVAYAIIHLLPIDLLLNVGSFHGLIMLCSMLLSSIIWNLGTWYFGLPASSSHTLIGGIIGISLTNACLTETSILHALNIPQVINILTSLVVSPLLGLIIAGSLMHLLQKYWRNSTKQKQIHMTPIELERCDGKKKPPFWIRMALILSAIGVSYSHGANDGQKGIGLIMLVLIGVAPAGFVVNMHASNYEIIRTRDAINHLEQYYYQHIPSLKKNIQKSPTIFQFESKENSTHLSNSNLNMSHLLLLIKQTQKILNNITSYQILNLEERRQLRQLLMHISDKIEIASSSKKITYEEKVFLKKLKYDILSTVEYAPIWIILLVALALSLGTMAGWQRIAITIGEKVGKTGMTYAQGVVAQVTAAMSIGVASYTGMPVSTTHILSSSVAGTMLISGGGVQGPTIRNIVIVWVLTLPISIILSGSLYWITITIL